MGPAASQPFKWHIQQQAWHKIPVHTQYSSGLNNNFCSRLSRMDFKLPIHHVPFSVHKHIYYVGFLVTFNFNALHLSVNLCTKISTIVGRTILSVKISLFIWSIMNYGKWWWIMKTLYEVNILHREITTQTGKKKKFEVYLVKLWNRNISCKTLIYRV